MSKKVMQQSETTEAGSYYAVTFGTLVVLIKRQFDTFMVKLAKWILVFRHTDNFQKKIERKRERGGREGEKVRKRN